MSKKPTGTGSGGSAVTSNNGIKPGGITGVFNGGKTGEIRSHGNQPPPPPPKRK